MAGCQALGPCGSTLVRRRFAGLVSSQLRRFFGLARSLPTFLPQASNTTFAVLNCRMAPYSTTHVCDAARTVANEKFPTGIHPWVGLIYDPRGGRSPDTHMMERTLPRSHY